MWLLSEIFADQKASEEKMLMVAEVSSVCHIIILQWDGSPAEILPLSKPDSS